jgi:hypothetical protein
LIEISACIDMDYVKEVMIDDKEMFERSRDDFTPDNVSDFLDTSFWCEIRVGGARIGLFTLKQAHNSVLDIHIHITKSNRGQGTLDVGRFILGWVVDNSPSNFFKLSTKIPVIYKDVIWFARRLGFKDEGIDRLSVSKGGNIIDRQNLGITFEEILNERIG